MQQATVNLFADMGVQPATLQAGLVAATASTDTTRADLDHHRRRRRRRRSTSATPVTITGTAADTGGGVVGGVEVSVDGGATWHPANGRDELDLHAGPPTARARCTIKARAVDDSGNIETPGAGVTVTSTSRVPVHRSGTASAAPGTPASTDTNAVELGVKFRTDSRRLHHRRPLLQGRRQHRHALGTCGPPPARCWRRATFTSETATGWQQVTFATPVADHRRTPPTSPRTSRPNGRYAADAGYFALGGVDNAAAARARATAPTAATASSATAPDRLPDQTLQAAQLLGRRRLPTSGADTTPPTVTARTPGRRRDGRDDARRRQRDASARRSTADRTIARSSCATPAAPSSPATVSYDAATRRPRSRRRAPLASATTYTATVGGPATRRGRQRARADRHLVVHDRVAPAPARARSGARRRRRDAASSDDRSAVELGVKFRADVAGYDHRRALLQGRRQHRHPLGQPVDARPARCSRRATFTGETRDRLAAGRPSPRRSPVTADTTYVASYFAPNGRYARRRRLLRARRVDNAPAARARATGVDGGERRLPLRQPRGFPTRARSSDATTGSTSSSTTSRRRHRRAPTVTGATPAAGATGRLGDDAVVRATFSEPIDRTATLTVDASGPGERPRGRDGRLRRRPTTATPHAERAARRAATAYTATASRAAPTDVAGNPLAATVHAGRSRPSARACPCTLWSSTRRRRPGRRGARRQRRRARRQVPRRRRAATITGVRFYKGAGQHRHARRQPVDARPARCSRRATFTGETASGWQQVTFATPVAVTAGHDLRRLLLRPERPLRARRRLLLGRGRRQRARCTRCRAAPTAATASTATARAASRPRPSGATNYWVDVVFDTTPPADTTPPTVTPRHARPPARRRRASTTPVTATFSEPIDPATVIDGTFELRDRPSALVPATRQLRRRDHDRDA